MRLIVLLLAGLLLFGCTAEDTSKGGTAANQTTQDMAVASAELAKHNMESDCWVLHNGSVFDISSYVAQHPNYQNVLVPHCGLSNSSFDDAFMGEHETSKIQQLIEEGELKGELED